MLEEQTRAMREDLLARQDEWLQHILDALHMTAEEAAELYYIHYDPLEVTRDGDTLRAVQGISLRRRDSE
jgi:hypothetical protein